MSFEQRDIVYKPFQATPKALGLFVLLTLGFGLFSVWLTGAWFSWPPRSELQVVAMIVPAVWPILLLQMGWSYALIADQLVASRFDKERYRVPLNTYERTSVNMGLLRLQFRHRTVWVVSSVDAKRQAFLAELQRRTRASVGTASGRVQQIDAERVRLRVADLHFPRACVMCGASADRTIGLNVQRGFDVILASHFQFVDVQVPVCVTHASKRKYARWLAFLALLPLTGVGATVLMLTRSGGVWSGALLVGLFGALVIFRPFYTMVGRRYLDWLVLGVHASDLSSDLTEVTLRLRNPEVARSVSRAAMTPGVVHPQP